MPPLAAFRNNRPVMALASYKVERQGCEWARNNEPGLSIIATNGMVSFTFAQKYMLR
jgi:hypothetical protein